MNNKMFCPHCGETTAREEMCSSCADSNFWLWPDWTELLAEHQADVLTSPVDGPIDDSGTQVQMV